MPSTHRVLSIGAKDDQAFVEHLIQASESERRVRAARAELAAKDASRVEAWRAISRTERCIWIVVAVAAVILWLGQ